MSGAGRLLAAGWALCLASLLPGCTSCPPDWPKQVSVADGYALAAGSSGDVFVEAEASSLALTRAARRLADHLRLDVERRLSVVLLDGRLFVEALGPEGLIHDLDGLELVSSVRCGDRTHVLLRLPLP